MAEILPVLKNPLFRRFIIGNGLSLIGVWIQRVALGWLTWELTHSGFWLGAIAFADLFPSLVIGPFAGVWADRYDRRNILLLTQSLSAALAVILFILVYWQVIGVGWLFVLSAGLGITTSIGLPARLALVPMLVDKPDMPAAVALNSVIFNTARFVGPMIAGAVIAFSDISLAFLINGLTYAIMTLVIATIPSGLHAINHNRDVHILKDIAEGIRYVLDHSTIRLLICIIVTVAILSKPVADLLPGFADVVFQRGAIGLALMTQVMGVGALLGGIWLAQFGSPERLPLITLGGFFSCGFFGIGFALTPDFYLAMVWLFFMSMGISMTGICTQTLIQQTVDENYRGRVMSLWGLIFRGAPSLGVLAMGLASDYSSLSAAVLVGSIIAVIVAAISYRSSVLR
ncbi:MAG: MFS transporter [Oceanicoccus sp.]